MMIKAAYFPTIIYAKDVNLNNRLFENAVIEWSQKDQGIKRTNLKGWHSETDMHKIPVFKPLVDELFKMQHEIYKEEWLDKEPTMGNMWANINPPVHKQAALHPNSHFSGAYILKHLKIWTNIFNDQDLEHTWLCLQEKKHHHHICGEKFV